MVTKKGKGGLNYFSRFHCQVINKTKLSHADAQHEAFFSSISCLSTVKDLEHFFPSENNSRFLSFLNIKGEEIKHGLHGDIYDMV